MHVVYDTSEFSTRLSTAIEQSHTCAKELAKDTGIGYNTVLAYMRGERNPTMHNIVLLCETLQIRADWLLGAKIQP